VKKKNKITFTQYNSYIHIYHVEGLNNMLSSQKDYIVNEFNILSKIGGGFPKFQYNFRTQNKVINKNLTSLFKKIINTYYLIDISLKYIHPMIYYQDKEKFKSIFHNHYNDLTLAATTYIDPLNKGEGGELQFYAHENEIISISPEIDCIYFFPGWMLHRPLPQNTNKKRICINWGVDCNNRPIHKLTGDRW